MDPTTWFWVGAAGMALGTLIPVRDLLRHPSHRRYDLVLTAVTAVATVAYAAMALGIGTVTVDGHTVQLARYADWLITTPLLVLYLVMLCQPSRRTYAAMVGAEVVVIGTGAAAALSATPTRTWAFYAIGCIAYLGLLYGLLRTLPRSLGSDADPRVTATFTTLRNLTVVLWTLYPVVWVLAPTGVGILNTEMEAIVVVYLDFIAKVGFVALASLGSDAIDRLNATPGREPSTD